MYHFRRFYLRANWPKTIWLNFRFLPFSQAKLFPIICFGRCKIDACANACIRLNNNDIYTGQILIGNNYCRVNGFNARNDLTCLNIRGTISFGKSVFISNGVKIYVNDNSNLEIGDYFYIGPNGRIACEESIIMGKCVRISWDCQIYDTNFHYITDMDGIVRKRTNPIVITHNCWVGNRTTISKGTFLPPFTIVASNSMVNKDFSGCEFTTIAGCPASVVSRGMARVFNFATEYQLDEILIKQRQSSCHLSDVQTAITHYFL